MTKNNNKGFYVKAETFEDFCENQETLINILNHRMTGIEKAITAATNDITWIKKLIFIISGLLTTILGATIVKLLLGV